MKFSRVTGVLLPISAINELRGQMPPKRAAKVIFSS